MKIGFFRDSAPYSLVEINRRFGRFNDYHYLKLLSIYIRLHVTESQKTDIFILVTV
jgi:hypothetical protein